MKKIIATAAVTATVAEVEAVQRKRGVQAKKTRTIVDKSKTVKVTTAARKG